MPDQLASSLAHQTVPLPNLLNLRTDVLVCELYDHNAEELALLSPQNEGQRQRNGRVIRNGK